MNLGEKIKELRTFHKLTLRTLAKQTGVSFTYLSKIENNKTEHSPSIKTLQDLARVLQIDELELMELADKVPSVFQPMARNKKAMQFYRRANETIKNSEDWDDLINYLDQREKDKTQSENNKTD